MDLNALLARVIEVGGSDLHLKVSSTPIGRVDGALVQIDDRVVSDADLEACLGIVTERTPAKRELFYATGELDTAYIADTIGRFRVNGFRQRGSISFAFRYVPRVVPSFKKLGLPPGVEKLAGEQRGLLLVTGATGSGKSTTLAAMVDHINRTRKQHIVTIEDPIEIVHDDWGCIVNQREIGLDTESYEQALRRVLSTMHTIDATETVGRLVEFFPAAKQMMVRQIIAGVLRGAVSQRLLPRVGGGRVGAVEVMVVTARIAELIRDPSKTEQIKDAIADGSYHLMQSFQHHLVQLVLDELVDIDTATAAATNAHDFKIAVEHALKAKARDEAESAEADDAVGALH